MKIGWVGYLILCLIPELIEILMIVGVVFIAVYAINKAFPKDESKRGKDESTQK